MNESAVMSVYLSDIDSKRFGVTVARIDRLDQHDVLEVLEWCTEREVDLLMARCPCGDTSALHEMERQGFLTMGCLVTYRHELDHVPPPEPLAGVALRDATDEDADAVADLARAAFEAHIGHYHADPRLDRSAANEVYASWAEGAVRQQADTTLAVIAESEGSVVGFATASEADTEVPIGGLAAVDPRYRRSGVYRALVAHRLRRLMQMGASATVVSADLANPAPQNCWTSLGYRIISTEYTTHWWDRGDG